MEVDTMVKSALGLAAMVGMGGNVYQSQNPSCDDLVAPWIAQVEVVREEGKEREINTRKHVMEWVDRTCPRDTTNMSSEAVFASYPFAPISVPTLPCASGASLCPEWPCESDHECLDCKCNEDGYCD